ncbi:Zinc-finger domain of monoamine-oxidase A repressor R1 [Artemisia annua]|uniref:Zinc-finger domain of monoamine-oxidase A repressor R1 n=1 Tax=Artemisia annua TaxID=35608 RepID=A0A2U1PPF5_ARTAN|nr:Zinc-finger domain of monoamine-oxidase A repressor R1 [Artemisia annua]
MSENEINHPEMESSSKNGVPCHQCRHKTYGVYASCTNQSKTKPCLLKYCDTCLLNRYGEKAEEVTLLDQWDCPRCRGVCNCSTCICTNQSKTKPCLLKYCDTCLLNRYGEKAEDVTLLDQWDCPRCRGVCNCSTCMKKRGHQPTGIVKAKAGGFTSVSDMIHVNGAENVSNYKRVKETRASSRKQGASTEGNVITSPKKPGKENLLDGKTDSNADPSLSVPSPVKENPTKKKRKGVEVMQDDTGVSDKALNEKKPKKSKLKASKDIVGGNANDGEAEENTTQHLEGNHSFESVSSLPTGSELVTIAGVDLPKEDAGNALQLLEFCYTFGKIVDVKIGHAEAALKDLIKGRSARRGKFTSLVQLHIQLLSVIQEESGSEPELEYVLHCYLSIGKVA